MSFFAELKAMSRRVVHDTLGVDAFYQDNTMSAPAPIKARWHNRINQRGDLVESGYAEVVEGIDRVILFPCDYPALSFKSGGVVSFPEYGVALRLHTLEPKDGGDQAVWQAVLT